MKIIFTCGGTGGHIYPAIALCNEFKKRDTAGNNEYLFVGSNYGLEGEIFQEEDIEHFELISSRGINRNILAGNIKAVFCNIYALLESRKIIKRFWPDIVIGTGAYPAFHMMYLAKKSGIPYYLIEGNAAPGLVTKLFYRQAKSVFASSPRLKENLDNSDNVMLTGIPSRVYKASTSREQILDKLGLDCSRMTITVIGGSCGSEFINSTVLEMLTKYEFDYQFIWSTGKKYSISKKFGKNIKLFDYIDNMPEILTATDLIISRAGAMTIQEIKEYKIPAVLVPFSKATGHHQFINAQELVDLGVAEVISESDINAHILKKTICEILSDESRLKNITATYDSVMYSNNNERVYIEIMKDRIVL